MKPLRERAMDLLARREHSREELCKKLVLKGYSSEEITPVVNQLREEGLQDDVRFTEIYISYRANAGFGPRRIRLELQERGVDEPLIDRFMWVENMDWQSLLKTVWQGKFNEFVEFGTKAYAAQQRFLMQRGFDPEDIHQLLKHQASGDP